MTVTDWLSNVASVAIALTAVLTIVAWFGRKLWRGGKRFSQFLDDYEGTPARPGSPARPGFMVRLDVIEASVDDVRHDLADVKKKTTVVHAELTPNGGHSVKDVVNRMDPGIPEEQL